MIIASSCVVVHPQYSGQSTQPIIPCMVVCVLSAWAFGERLMRVLMGVTFSVALSEPCSVLVLEE